LPRSADDFANFAILQRYRWSSGGEAAHRAFYEESGRWALSKLASPRMKERRMTVRLLLHMTESPLIRELVLAEIRTRIGATTGSANLIHGIILLSERLFYLGVIDEDFRQKIINWVTSSLSTPCYPIDVLVQVKAVEASPTINRITLPSHSLDTAIKDLCSRKISYDLAADHIKFLAEKCGTNADSSDADIIQIIGLFESFWTSPYDLEGSLRRLVAINWQPVDFAGRASREELCKRQDCLLYLMLTDDDEVIRGAASDRAECSVAALLRQLIDRSWDAIVPLHHWTPEDSCPQTIDNKNSRASLFAAEPLNTFKDPDWEVLMLKRRDTRIPF
jgi:hypothetical protein